MEVWTVNWSGDYFDCDAVCSSYEKATRYILDEAKRMHLENFHLVDESPIENFWAIYQFDDSEEIDGMSSVTIQKFTVDGFNIII